MESTTRNLIIWSSIGTAFFFLSLVLFLTRPDRKDRFVLFFPSETTFEWTGEARNIPHKKEVEDSVHELLKELTLGPIRLRLENVLPPDTGLRSVLLREDVLYIDFTEHLAIFNAGMSVSFDTMLEGVKKSVLFNFPAINDIIIFVGGSTVAGRLGAR